MKLITIFLTLTILSCKNNTPSNQTKQADKQPETTKTGNPIVEDKTSRQPLETKGDPVQQKKDSGNYRMVVMFYSIGEGVENEFVTAFEDSISAYSAKIGKNIDYERTPWGREGETDFCMQLFELSEVEKTQFISQTKRQLKKAKWVNINENYPCKHRRNH